MIADDDVQFKRILQQILNQAGLDCMQYKTSYLKRRLAVRMRATHAETYNAYGDVLRNSPGEYELLLDRLTINVSQFFRDAVVFQRLRELVLPRWRDRARIRIWSAGCANGEEPYSLSILLQEYLPGRSRVDILATDLDPACIERARRGVYKAASLVQLPPELRRKYFRAEGEAFAVKPEVKDLVRFQRHDLTGQLVPGPFDMILCRNVLIYFNHELQEKLFSEFHRILTLSGILVLGKTETLLGNTRQQYYALDVRERIYERRDPPSQA